MAIIIFGSEGDALRMHEAWKDTQVGGRKIQVTKLPHGFQEH